MEISNVSNALIGLQSQQARDRDAGGLKVTKIKSKQSKHTSRIPVCKEDLDKAITEVTGTFDGVEEIRAELREGIVNYIQRRPARWKITAVPVTTWHMGSVGNTRHLPRAKRLLGPFSSG